MGFERVVGARYGRRENGMLFAGKNTWVWLGSKLRI